MQTIMTIPVRNGGMTETYSVTRDAAGDIFLHDSMDIAATMHIDPAAFGALSMAFAALDRLRIEDAGPKAGVVQFPRRGVLVGGLEGGL